MNYNKALISGRLGQDPQLSYTPSKTPFVTFSVASTRTWYDAQKAKQEEACWIDVQAWGKTAETINKHFSKGDPIFLEGYLKFETWTAKDGTKRSKHKLVAQDFRFLPRAERQQDAPPQNQSPTGEEIPF